MSSGVDQIKPVLTGGKEERNIPWSQQVDEASCENLTITSNDENLASVQSPPKFQYPPFKENHSSVNFKSRKNTNTEITKKYGRSAYHNSKRDEHYGVSWGGSNLKNPNVENNSLVHRESRDRLSNHGNIECSNTNNYIESKISSQPPVTQKKTTWALIASQPAKHTLKVSLTSTQKKKGPGMPPPPMVPGKHDLDATAWEMPANNPPPVPSPPLHIDLSQHENGMIDPTHNFGRDNDSLRKESNKSLELLKDDNRNSIHRSRYTPNSHVRKTWNNIHSTSNSNRRHISTAENGVQRKMENIRKNPYLGVRNDQERGNQIYHKCENDSNENTSTGNEISSQTSQAVLDELRIKNNYNPSVLDMEIASSARFFVIKSYSEDDIHRSIKYEIWCSTENGNKRLDDAFKEQENEGGTVLLFFSVNGSGHFCGVAQMMTSVDYNSTSSVWSQDKWKGKFKVKWLYVKDVPNYNLRHIKLENNENKAVTHSRDTQEVPNSKGVEVLQIIHSFKHDTSIFDDFHHYEIKQVEGCAKKFVNNDPQSLRGNSPNGRNNQKLMDERDRDFDRESRGTARHFMNSGNNNFRERNRSGFQNFSDSKNSNDYLSRYSQKYEIVRRDKINKQIHREREHVDDRINNGHKFRTDLRDTKIDNEFEDQR